MRSCSCLLSRLYAAELLWRERDTHFDGIHDALPMSESTDWFSRLTASLRLRYPADGRMLIGVVMQTIAGYYHYELLQYFKELYLVTFPQILTFSSSHFSCRPLCRTSLWARDPDRRLVLMPILYSFGWENTLFLTARSPPIHIPI